jgi:EAL and modified HD-GYP domain-containing signal transduction protein
VRISHVGIQPIVRPDLSVQGYELLFRGERREFHNGATMTSQVIMSALLDIGLDRLTGDLPAYVNVPRSMFIDRLLLAGSRMAGRDQLVLEIPESCGPDEVLLAALSEHRRAGFILALDDYTGQPHQQALLPHVQIVKVDLPDLTPAEIGALIEPLRGTGQTLLAEKVETAAQLEVCRELGFDLFQGYLLSRPVVHSQGTLAPSRAMCLRLLSTLADPLAEPTELRRLVNADPALSLRILRAASLGAAGGSRRSMRSVTEALVMLGMRRLTTLVILTLLADDGAGPTEQLKIAMTRAKMCELLATEARIDSDRGYTVGLLSAMDLLLGVPLAEVLAGTDLDDDLRDALLSYEGPLGQVLGAVLGNETGGCPDLSGLGVSEEQVARAYLRSLSYARSTFDSLISAA